MWCRPLLGTPKIYQCTMTIVLVKKTAKALDAIEMHVTYIHPTLVLLVEGSTR